MAVEIPVKKKYLPLKRLYGYPRTHNGNSHRKVKKTGSFVGAKHIYNPRDHALWLQPNGKLKMIHGAEARKVLGEE